MRLRRRRGSEGAGQRQRWTEAINTRKKEEVAEIFAGRAGEEERMGLGLGLGFGEDDLLAPRRFHSKSDSPLSLSLFMFFGQNYRLDIYT